MVNYINSVLRGFIIFGFIFSALMIYTNDENNELLQSIVIDRIDEINKIELVLFGKSLDELTPLLEYNLPLTEKKIFLINQFPIPGWAHTILFILSISLFFFIIKNFGDKIPWYHKINLFILFFIFAYILASLTLYIIFQVLAHRIGFSFSEANQLLTDYTNNFDNVLTPIIMFTFINIFIVVRHFLRKMFEK